jgi:hypothetical protein
MSLKSELEGLDPENARKTVYAHDARMKSLSDIPSDEFDLELEAREQRYAALYTIVEANADVMGKDLTRELMELIVLTGTRIVEILVDIAEIQEMPSLEQ